MTLPLIYTVNHCDKTTKNKIIRIFKYPNKNSKEINFILDTVKKHGGIEYAEQKMRTYIQEAFEKISTIEESEALLYLKELVNYTIDRKY